MCGRRRGCGKLLRSGNDWDGLTGGYDLGPFYRAEMDYEQGTLSSSERPDKPLVMRSEYNAHHQKLSFKSARFCTYGCLKEKVLSLSPLVIALVLAYCFLVRATLWPGCASIYHTMEG
jgi:hypothetical protein